MSSDGFAQNQRGTGVDGAAVERLVAVVARLRTDCPWDAEQTPRSLVPYLLEEAYEVVEAIETSGETGDHDHLREELGDLLLQVVFHVIIAAETDPSASLARVADGIAEKLISRHPHVFAGETISGVEELNATWEARKAVEKGRRSVLEGIPDLPALARATKIISRARARGVPLEPGPDGTVGERILTLVATANTDPDQSLRDAVRALEHRVRAAELDPPPRSNTL